MGSTRRGTANAESTTAGMERLGPIRQASDTIHVLVPIIEKAGKASLKRKVRSSSSDMAISGTISEHDLSLTSPSTGETPKLLAMSTPEKKQGSSDISERTVSSALRRLSPRLFANMSGSCHNPIIVEETVSPPRQVVRAPKRRHRHRRLPEPHQFTGNGYRDLYSYRPSRPALSAMPANGNTFTGHQSHDIYRMMNAKITAAPDLSPNAAWARHTLNVPFEVQYPLSAQVLAQQQHASPYQSPYAQCQQAQAAPNTHGYTMVLSQNEDMLRRRAVQYIREHSRLMLQKRWLSDADPGETSNDEIEEHQQHTRSQPNTSTPQSSSMPPSTIHNVVVHINHEPRVYQDHLDSDEEVGHLIEYTSLITSLLQLYSHSTDRKGLQNDISRMVQVQNQHVTDWMKAETRKLRKRRKSNSGSTVSLDGRPQPNVTPATRTQNENDNTLRQIFSAQADMWQDGTGNGVADVFAVVPASSPVVSSLHERIAGPTHVPFEVLIARDFSMEGKTGNTSNTITTSTEQIPTSTAVVAHNRDIPTTLSVEELRGRFDHPSINAKDKSKSLTNLHLPSSPSRDSATPTKTTLHHVNTSVTPSSNRIHTPSSSHSNHSKRSEHARIQHAAPSSDNDELHVPNRSIASSSFQSESSNDFRIRKPTFRT